MFAPDILNSETFTAYQRPGESGFRDILSEYQAGATDIGTTSSGCLFYWLSEVAPLPPVDHPAFGQAGCELGDKAMYTPAVEGTTIRFRAGNASLATCSDQLVLNSTTCTPAVEQYGMYLGDGTSMDIDAMVDYSSGDDEPSANFLTLVGSFDHQYASAGPHTAYFTGGERAGDPASPDYVHNVPGGRFRLEARVLLTVDNYSPVIVARPVIPIPIIDLARDTSRLTTQMQFHVAAFDPDGDGITFSLPTGPSAARLLGGVTNYHAALLAGDTTLAATAAPAQPGAATPGFLSVDALTGLFTMSNPQLLAPGMHSMVVQVSDGRAVVSADVSLYLYHQLYFCHADCYRNSSGLVTPANPDGWYGDFDETGNRCSICSYAGAAVEQNCQPKYVNTITGVPGCESFPGATDCEPSGCPAIFLQ